ncbi:DUF1028 domain-containing protein [soil metagenome]
MLRTCRRHSRRVALWFVICTALATSVVAAQEPLAWSGGLYFGTFSIAAVDPETGEVGVAVTSRVPCVGNVVPHVRAGVGAVATQAMARVEVAALILDSIQAGRAPRQSLEAALVGDRSAAGRQIGVIGIDGRSAQHTGSEAVAWAGQRDGRNYVTQGNLLVGGDVLRAVAREFEASDGSGRSLADRLISALSAGVVAGGDMRKGVGQSAAVVVADPRPGRSHRAGDITADISVCEHPEPVYELRRIYQSVSETLGYRTLQQYSGADVFQLKLMLHALGYYRSGEPEPRPDLTSHLYTADAVQAVNAFRDAERLSGPALGTPQGLVDDELIARLWAALERRGLADDVHRRLRSLTPYP